MDWLDNTYIIITPIERGRVLSWLFIAKRYHCVAQEYWRNINTPTRLWHNGDVEKFLSDITLQWRNADERQISNEEMTRDWCRFNVTRRLINYQSIEAKNNFCAELVRTFIFFNSANDDNDHAAWRNELR